MTIEKFIQSHLENISSIKNYVGKNIFSFVADSNPSKCFIRWYLISESDAVRNISDRCSLKIAEVQISIFSNTVSVGRTIADEVMNAFDFNHSIENIRCSYPTELNPIHEDKNTIHYPIRIKIYYNKEI